MLHRGKKPTFFFAIGAHKFPSSLACIFSDECSTTRFNKKLSYPRQTARRICANTMTSLTSCKDAPPYLCYHAEFDRSTSKSVGINRGERSKLGILELHSLGMEGMATQRYTQLGPHVGTAVGSLVGTC